MKSLLQEGSSVATAIEKAWTEAGKPIEFTIKILAQGEKSFLGLSKEPAIISLLYDPKKQTAPLLEKVKTAIPRKREEPQKQKPKVRPRIEKKPPAKPQAPPKRRELWEEKLVTLITSWLKDTIDLMGIKTPFSTRVERRTLFLTFEKPLIENENDEKMLLSSLALLFLHALQKKQKRKMPENKLMLTSKRSSSGQQK